MSNEPLLRRWRIVDICIRPQFISDVAVKWILELPCHQIPLPRSERERDRSSSVIHSRGSHPRSAGEAFHGKASSLARRGHDYRLSILLGRVCQQPVEKTLSDRWRSVERRKLSKDSDENDDTEIILYHNSTWNFKIFQRQNCIIKINKKSNIHII